MSQWNRKIKCVQNGWEIPLKKGRAEDSRQGPSVRGNGRGKVCKRKQGTNQQGKHKISTVTNGQNKNKHFTEWNPTSITGTINIQGS